MVVERFAPGAAPDIYRRVREGGRGLPDGLRYLDSWVRADLRGCFQLMECDSAPALQEWVASWDALDGLRDRARHGVTGDPGPDGTARMRRSTTACAASRSRASAAWPLTIAPS